MSKIKKSAIALFFMAVVIIFSCMALAGCGNVENRIENHNWQFDNVQTADGEVIACSSDSAWLSDGIQAINLTISVNDGTFVIADDAQNTYAFSYKQISSSHESTIYEIEYNGRTGLASVSRTYYKDKKDVPTLIVTINDYNLYYYEK